MYRLMLYVFRSIPSLSSSSDLSTSLPRISNGNQSAPASSRRRPGSGGDSKKKPVSKPINGIYKTFWVQFLFYLTFILDYYLQVSAGFIQTTPCFRAGNYNHTLEV